jgi:hypothetical protein
MSAQKRKDTPLLAVAAKLSSWIGTPPTLRVFAIRGVLGPQRGNDRFANGLRCARFGRDSAPDCVRRSDFSADVRRCDVFYQACC